MVKSMFHQFFRCYCCCFLDANSVVIYALHCNDLSLFEFVLVLTKQMKHAAAKQRERVRNKQGQEWVKGQQIAPILKIIIW